MSAVSMLVLALGLAMDAMAVAAARGLSAPRLGTREVLSVALFFGGFQGAMPLLGALLGRMLGPLVERWDHWIAFVLLVGLGLKMLHEARALKAEGARLPDDDPFAPRVLVVLAVATSIDAFAVGITLPIIGAPVAFVAAVIAVVTALLSALGLFLGRRVGAMLGPRLDMLGGVVLIGLGCKILAEHLS